MKILLAVDGSRYGDAAVKEVIQRMWPAATEVRVISVAHPTPYFHDPLLVGAGTHFDSLRDEQKRALHDVEKVAEELRQKAPHLHTSTKVLEGSPKEQIIDEAREWNSDLIIVGSHGHGPVGPFLLGSVSLAVALHAPCSVEIVRPRE